MSGDGILVTGGLGYIGSHAVVALAQAGYRPVIVDDLSNADLSVLQALERLCGRRPAFHRGDVRDRRFLAGVLRLHPVRAALHFAGRKAVAESVRDPLGYYDANVAGSLQLAAALDEAGIRRLVFSSSATVYGEPPSVPVAETQPAAPLHPYGRSKWMVEQVLQDLCRAHPGWSVVSLRYFNPAGAHESGLIGERPAGFPNNLMPYVTQVARGERDCLQVFGDDYPTRDGTGERDYVHVMDVAEAHVAALALVGRQPGYEAVNLGTGVPCSVLELVAAFEAASGRRIARRMAPRRAGDIAVCYADPRHAQARLGWRARRDLAQMCRDAARFALGPAVPPGAGARGPVPANAERAGHEWPALQS